MVSPAYEKLSLSEVLSKKTVTELRKWQEGYI